jgi:hypothetical protein
MDRQKINTCGLLIIGFRMMNAFHLDTRKCTFLFVSVILMSETGSSEGLRDIKADTSNLYEMFRRHTRSVCEVHECALLLRVGTLWRYGDSLFFEVPPLASDAHLTTLHPLLENVLQTVDHVEISCLGAPFSWLEKPRNRKGRDLDW